MSTQPAYPEIDLIFTRSSLTPLPLCHHTHKHAHLQGQDTCRGRLYPWYNTPNLRSKAVSLCYIEQLNLTHFSINLIFRLSSSILYSVQNLMTIEKFGSKFVEVGDGLGRRTGGGGGCWVQPEAQGSELAAAVLLFLCGSAQASLQSSTCSASH